MVRTRKVNLGKVKDTVQGIYDSPFNPRNYEDPQTGLVPIPGTPFYATPDEPADPFDCGRYPDSLYCGQPFTNIPIGIEPAIVKDDCNLGIQLTPTLGFVILPPVQIVYRKPGCRVKEPKEPIPPTLNNFEILPSIKETEAGCLYMVTVGIDYYDLNYQTYPDVVDIRYFQYPNDPLTRQIRFVWGQIYGLAVQNDVYPTYNNETKQDDTIERSRAWIVCKANAQSDIGLGKEFFNTSYVGRDLYSVEDRYPYLKRVSKLVKAADPKYWEYNGVLQINNYGSIRVPPPRWRIINIEELWCDRSPILINPPPPPLPLPHCDCNMTCCPSTTQNDQLLRILIKKVDKLSQIVGIDDYPASLPTSLISKDEGFLGNLIPNENREIPNLTQFLLWYVERFDEIMGQWEIPIEIKDSDPTKPGDQPLGVRLSNMAEAIGEMFTLAFQTNLNSEVLLNFAVRNAAESMTDKQQNFITYKLLQSLTDWVGYKQKDTKEKMPMLFTLGKTRYDEILKESEIEVPCIEFDDKFGLEADLMRFREAVSILQALHKKKIDPNGDIKGQILKYLLDTFAATKKVNGDDEDDMDEFIQQVEEGFGQVPGVTDPLKPYGRDYTQRPKIRDLTKLQPPQE